MNYKYPELEYIYIETIKHFNIQLKNKDDVIDFLYTSEEVSEYVFNLFKKYNVYIEQHLTVSVWNLILNDIIFCYKEQLRTIKLKQIQKRINESKRMNLI